MWHVNWNNEKGKCGAKDSKDCPFYGNGDRHYENEADATAASEKALSAEHGDTPKTVRYSFVKSFEKQEEQFETDFDGFPNRFFNANLRDKKSVRNVNLDNYTDEELDEHTRYIMVNPKKAAQKMAAAASQPNDFKMSDEELYAMTERNGLTNTRPIENNGTLLALKADRAWVAENEHGDQVIIYGNAANSRNLYQYSFRGGKHPDLANNRFIAVDARTLAGGERIERKTGYPMVRDMLHDNRKGDTLSGHRTNALYALRDLEEAQLEGANFIAQRKHIKSHSGKVATAWMDKKGADETRQEMMKNTSLNNSFRKVEIDNDVDPEEYADFERSYEEIREALPPIPAGQEPELRIRKLGKHNANGVYFGHTNTVAVDVRTSEAFIHEMGHYYDLTANGNASLQKDFREVTKEYSKNLKLPEEMSKKGEYYKTPTEIFARGMEVYTHERLGVKNNRLLNESKFNNFDYAPITQNPEMKEKLFTFYDKLFAEQRARVEGEKVAA